MMRSILWAVFLLSLLTSNSMAAELNPSVTGKCEVPFARENYPMNVELCLAAEGLPPSGQGVLGAVAGELIYDGKWFANPSVTSSPYYKVFSHEVSGGLLPEGISGLEEPRMLRFVLVFSPMQPVNLSPKTSLTFTFDVKELEEEQAPKSSRIYFNRVTAATVDGASSQDHRSLAIQNVSIEGPEIEITDASVKDWLKFK